MHLSEEQVRWFRLRRSGLIEPFASAKVAAAALAGVQAQILTASMLALWNRTAEGARTEGEVAGCLFGARSLVRLWGQRHTLHLYDTRDWPLINAAHASRRTWWEREAGRDPAVEIEEFRAGVARAAELLRERGTLSRKDLRASGIQMPEALFSPWGGVFAELVRIGEACHARWDGGEARYAHRTHWLSALEWSPPDAEAANLELARRYFRCYGPASADDMAYWRGASIGAARRWVGALADELSTVSTETLGGSREMLVLKEDLAAVLETPPDREAWPVQMLGRFDPLLLAHREKDWVVPTAVYDRVWRPAGHIEGVVLGHGRAVASWRYVRVGTGRLEVRVFPFRPPLPLRVSKAVRHRAKEVAGFFGLKLSAVRIERSAAARP